jgi:hypothetical protein
MDPGSLVSSSLILHPVPYMRPFLSLPTAEAVMRIPTALTIAGSDSGGGAGIQADLKTFTLYGVYGMTAITAVTVQNTEGVFGVVELPPDVVAAQIDVVVRDIGVDAAKTGMLANAGIVQAVAEAVRRNGIERLVVDPVLRAKSGDPLLRPEAERALIEDLLPWPGSSRRISPKPSAWPAFRSGPGPTWSGRPEPSETWAPGPSSSRAATWRREPRPTTCSTTARPLRG